LGTFNHSFIASLNIGLFLVPQHISDVDPFLIFLTFLLQAIEN